MSAIIAEGVKPSLGELEKFEDQPEGLDMEGKRKERVFTSAGTINQYNRFISCTF